MPIDLKMPALSPTMEEGTLARWLVKEGDTVAPGDLIAEIETDKATMEFEAVDEGTVAKLLIDEGTEGVAVGTVIARLAGEGEDAAKIASKDEPAAKEEPNPAPAPAAKPDAQEPAPEKGYGRTEEPVEETPAPSNEDRIVASPVARRLAEQHGVDLETIKGTGPKGRIVKADVEAAAEGGSQEKPEAATTSERAASSSTPSPSPTPSPVEAGAPFEAEKLSNVRKVIARRLTESKQTVPHYYLTVDVDLDPLLALRAELNAALAADGIKLSVNDLLIKALARALIRVPQCNVSFQGDSLHRYSRADISVAVAAPSGLITPIVTEADTRGLASISATMRELAEKAREGKLQPHEYQGGTASLSNLGMFGIKQFDAVINPPQGMILAVGAGQKRPYVVDGALGVATVMSASGSFDHRAIDGADGAQLMEAFRDLVEAPMALTV